MTRKFYGVIGFGGTVETSPGVYVDEIVERSYFGDVVRNSRRLNENENLNNDISVGNSISIVADAYASEHFFNMRYISFAGTLWSISEVEVQSPRLTLRLGGVYNGPQATAAGDVRDYPGKP